MHRTVEAHLTEVLAGVTALPPFDLALLDARGCRLSADVTAPAALPPFSSATCEGFAVRAADVASASRIAPVRLLVVDAVAPGSRPRLAVVPGAALLPGTVSDSNGVMLSALVQQLGAVAYRVGPVADDAAALEQVLADQLVRADLVIVAGGVAASSYETVLRVANRLGSMTIERVAMTPGTAQGFGHLGDDGIPMLTLPGHPAAAFVSFEVFASPVIRRMAGDADVAPRLLRAQLLTGVRSGSGRRQFIPSVRVPGTDGVLRVQPLHSEHVTAELARADCLLVVPEMVEQLVAGDVVDVQVLEGAA